GIPSAAGGVGRGRPAIGAVGRAIGRGGPAGRAGAVSLWPGFFVESEASILPGLENHFALMFSDMVTPREVVQFKLMSYAGLAWHVQRHTVDVIVLGNWTSWTANSHRFRSLIVRNGYVMKERIASAEIYTLPPDGRR